MLAENSKSGLNQSTSSANQTSSAHSAWLTFEAVVSRVQRGKNVIIFFIFFCFYCCFFMFTGLRSFGIKQWLWFTTFAHINSKKNSFMSFLIRYSLIISTLKSLFSDTGSVSSSKQTCLLLHDVTHTVSPYFKQKSLKDTQHLQVGEEIPVQLQGKSFWQVYWGTWMWARRFLRTA